MFPELISRTVDLWRAIRPGASAKHSAALFESPDSSPRSSTDTEYILPLSSSPRKTSFDSVDFAPSPQIKAYFRLFPSVHASLLLVIILFPLSTAVTLLCLSTLPITFAWPRTLTDLAQLGRDLNTYSQSGFLPTAHILGTLSVTAVWKHAWSIPGSVLWNVLAGALFHPLLATLVMTVLTTIGSLFATLLAMPLSPVLTRLFPRPIELTRAALEGSSLSNSSSFAAGTPAWVRLSVLRLVGVVPWSALNIACGITGVALRDCIAGAFIGSLPWTAVTCQVGDILQTVGMVGSANDAEGVGLEKSATLSSALAQPQIVLELVFLSVLSLAPILGRDRLRKLISPSDETSTTVEIESVESDTTVYTSDKEVPPTKQEEKDAEYEKLGRRGRRSHRQRWTWNRVSMSVPRWSALNSPIRQSFFKDECDSRQ
ncbi:snare associated Golgi protein-domain-containing protein [Phellopilus nigrolimitatus]|nr:snare associated Golgi protein-domain-containing protein [Phellopilus nigrolimitatus]